MEEGLNETNIHARTGTVAHEIAAEALMGNASVQSNLGSFIDGIEVNADMIEHVLKYTTRAEEYRQTLLMRHGVAYRAIERALPVHLVTGEEGAEGTADLLLWAPGELQVHDLKYGLGEVKAEGNEQLMVYALAAIRSEGLNTLDTIRLVIHQPRLNIVDEWVVSFDELVEFEKIVHAAAKVALASKYGENLHPSNTVCKFCKAAGNCPALKSQVEELLGVNLTALTEENIPNAEKYYLYINKLPMIERFVDAVKLEAYRAALVGEKIPGKKLVRGRDGNRKYGDEEKIKKLLRRLKVSAKLTYKKTLLGPAALEKVLSSNEDVWTEVKSHIIREEGKLVLVDETEKGDEVTIQSLKEE